MNRTFWQRLAPIWLTFWLAGQYALLLSQVGGTLELFRGRVYDIPLPAPAVWTSAFLNFARSGATGIVCALLMLALVIGILFRRRSAWRIGFAISLVFAACFFATVAPNLQLLRSLEGDGIGGMGAQMTGNPGGFWLRVLFLPVLSLAAPLMFWLARRAFVDEGVKPV